MAQNYRRMLTAELVSKTSSARKAEATRRLANSNLRPANVRTLTAYLGQSAPVAKAKATKAPAKAKVSHLLTSDQKKVCWQNAERIAAENGVHIRSAEFWPIYKAETLAARTAA